MNAYATAYKKPAFLSQSYDKAYAKDYNTFFIFSLFLINKEFIIYKELVL